MSSSVTNWPDYDKRHYHRVIVNIENLFWVLMEIRYIFMIYENILFKSDDRLDQTLITLRQSKIAIKLIVKWMDDKMDIGGGRGGTNRFNSVQLVWIYSFHMMHIQSLLSNSDCRPLSLLRSHPSSKSHTQSKSYNIISWNRKWRNVM